jgi:hypothetical protein
MEKSELFIIIIKRKLLKSIDLKLDINEEFIDFIINHSVFNDFDVNKLLDIIDNDIININYDFDDLIDKTFIKNILFMIKNYKIKIDYIIEKLSDLNDDDLKLLSKISVYNNDIKKFKKTNIESMELDDKN